PSAGCGSASSTPWPGRVTSSNCTSRRAVSRVSTGTSRSPPRAGTGQTRYGSPPEAAGRSPVLRPVVVDLDREVPTRQALLEAESPTLAGPFHDVVVVTPIHALGDVRVAREHGKELAVHRDRSGGIGRLVDKDVRDVVGGWVVDRLEPLQD